MSEKACVLLVVNENDLKLESDPSEAVETIAVQADSQHCLRLMMSATR
jgi:hypothetical protein